MSCLAFFLLIGFCFSVAANAQVHTPTYAMPHAAITAASQTRTTTPITHSPTSVLIHSAQSQSIQPSQTISLTSLTPQAPSNPATSSTFPTLPPIATRGSAPEYSPPGFTPIQGARLAPSFEAADYERGQLLLLWHHADAARDGIARLLTQYQLRPTLHYVLANLGFTVVMIRMPDERQAAEFKLRLQREQPDWIVDLNALSQPLQSTALVTQIPPMQSAPAARLYALDMLGKHPAAQSPMAVHAAQSVRIGIVDTGIEQHWLKTDHHNGSVLTMRSMLRPSEAPAPAQHGSTIFQLLASQPLANGFMGAAPPAHLYWANVMREAQGRIITNSLTLALALDWLVGQKVHLINLSLGGRGDAVLKASIEKAISHGIAIVAAAGNNHNEKVPQVFPAAYEGVFSVQAIDANFKQFTQVQNARHVSISAPGVELWLPTIDGQGKYVSGSSYAAALATASIAWQNHLFWQLSHEKRMNQLCSYAKKQVLTNAMGCGVIQFPHFEQSIAAQ